MTTPQEALHTVLDAMGALGNQCVLVALVGKDEAARVFAALSQQAQEPQPSDKEKLFDYLSALAAEAGFENISAAIAQARWGAAAPAKPADDHPEIVQLRAQNDHLVALYDAVDDFLKPTGGGINATLHLRLREAFAVAKDAKPADQEKAARGRLCLASALKEIAEAREAAGKIKPSMYHFGKMETLKEIEDRLICYAHPAKQCLVMHADGGLYEHIGTANGAGQSAGGEPLEIYRGAKDGNVWYRSPTDFAGRFCAYETSGHINGAVEMVAEAEQQAPAITEQAPDDRTAGAMIRALEKHGVKFTSHPMLCDVYAAALRSEQAPAGEDERKAFDKWHTRYGKGFVVYSEFNGVELTAAWKAWQARAALSTSPAGESEAKLKDDVGPRDFGIPPEHCEAAKHYAAFMLDRALSTPPAVPPGHVIVPVEPTKDMLDAAEKIDWADADVRGNCCNQWNAMLSAAPAAPQPQKEQP